MATLPLVAEPRIVLGHPRGLFVLFMTEMWERFSFYGMRALFVFYLTKHFLFGDDRANLAYGAYTSLVYITPVVGGWLADRYLGGRKAVQFGGVLIAIGHFCLAIEGALPTFYLALGFIIVGTGLLKANVSAIVGTLYPRDDLRRDPAYAIFYSGINLGAFLGALACGWLGERVGWNWGFGAAGLGMLAGLVSFVAFRRDLLGRSEPPDPAALGARVAGLTRETWIYAASIAGVMLVWALMRHQGLIGLLLGLAGLLLVIYLLVTAVRTLPADERDRLFAAMILMAGSILFWALYEQAGSSINLYTDRSVDRTLFGWTVPASFYQSVNPFWVITLAPVTAALWTWLGKRGWEPSAPTKFGLGLLQLGLGYFVLVWGARANAGALTPSIYIVLLYFFHSSGELCLSPVGLSAMTRMAIPRMAGLLMGTWFFATAAGEYGAGLLASMTGSGAESAARTLAVYGRVGWWAVAAGVMFLVAAPFIRRLMHLDTLGAAGHALAGETQLAEPAAAGLRTQGERTA